MRNRYFFDAPSVVWEVSLPSDKVHAKAVQQAVQSVETVRKRMYQIVTDHLDDYCRGDVLPEECAALPTVASLEEGIDRNDMSIEEFQLVIQSRLFALINACVDEHREYSEPKPMRTKKPRVSEAVFA